MHFKYKEEVVVTLLFLIGFCAEALLTMITFPTLKSYWIMFLCIIGMIIPWLRDTKVVHGKVKCIELCEITTNKKILKQ